MKKRTALLIAIITAFTAMPVSPVLADTAIPEEAVLLEGLETEPNDAACYALEPDGIEKTEYGPGYGVGTSLLDSERIDYAKDMMAKAAEKGVNFLLSEDVVVAPEFDADAIEPGADATSFDEISPDSATKTIRAGICPRGNVPSRSYYITQPKLMKKPTNLTYNSSIGSATIMKFAKNRYCVRFTFKKDEKRTANISFEYGGKKYKYKLKPVVRYHKKAVKNIKVGKIRLHDFKKSYMYEERPVSGTLDVDPESGWEIMRIYKDKAWQGKEKIDLPNHNKITLEKYDSLCIGLKNKKSGKVVWYIYQAFH